MWLYRSKRTYLGPFSFGLAVGIAMALAVLGWLLWLMIYGVPSSMVGRVEVPTLANAFGHSLWVLLQGFIFGFFVALFYDFFSWCCAAMCHKSGCGSECGSSCKCGPGCSCHANKKVNEVAERIRDH